MKIITVFFFDIFLYWWTLYIRFPFVWNTHNTHTHTTTQTIRMRVYLLDENVFRFSRNCTLSVLLLSLENLSLVRLTSGFWIKSFRNYNVIYVHILSYIYIQITCHKFIYVRVLLWTLSPFLSRDYKPVDTWNLFAWALIK